MIFHPKTNIISRPMRPMTAVESQTTFPSNRTTGWISAWTTNSPCPSRCLISSFLLRRPTLPRPRLGTPCPRPQYPRLCSPVQRQARPLSEYTGAYWRTAALASPSPAFASLPPPLSPTFAGLALPTSISASLPSTDLPPPHMRAALLDTYRTVVHPALPILSPSQCASLPALEASPMLLLALCAYTARLAPPAVPTRIAADLWYESACALLSSALRRAVVQADTVQTLLLLALRDHGRARDALAWRGVGAAVRIAVELGLDGGESTHENESREATPGGDRDPSGEAWKRSLWGVASMLDLFLSIQLGRAPASAEALRPLPSAPLAFAAGANAGLPSPSSSTASASTSVSNTLVTLANASASESEDDTAADAELAGHIRALVRIVARVHFCVALGYGVPHSPTSPATTSSPLAGSSISRDGVQLLRAELTAWHRGLPQRFRVALGGERVPRAVLEVHMLYQVAVGMLARGSGLTFNTPKSGAVGAVNSNPSSSYGSAAGNGTDAEADDAASTFNVLLDKYRPSLPLAGPPVVWLVFAAARAGLQRVSSSKGSVQHSGGGVGTARALQTQLYLLNCREALASMGVRGSLRGGVQRTLERMMEGESGESRPRFRGWEAEARGGRRGWGRKDESAQRGGGEAASRGRAWCTLRLRVGVGRAV
ncbi:hypothetical protein B0H14DRAFT_1235256 [Mycena olivaceomarginata]|nr:hypothetical protein B0H14DRAFT_1235256 [Mycena olivaceomarginata]